METLELGVDVLVDIVVDGRIVPRESRCRVQHGQRRCYELALEADQNCSLADSLTYNLSRFFDSGCAGRVALDHGKLRDVSCRAIAVVGHHLECLGLAGFIEEDLGWFHIQLGDHVDLGIAKWRTLRDPLDNRIEGVRALFKAKTAFVRHAHRRLGQHQASGGHRSVEAPAGDFKQQGAIVELGVVAAQGQFETVLALSRAVARPGSASGVVEHGHHVTQEGDAALIRRGRRNGSRGNSEQGRDGDQGVDFLHCKTPGAYPAPAIVVLLPSTTSTASTGGML